MRLVLAVVRPSPGRQHGKPKLKILRVRVEMLGAGEDSSRGRTAHFHSIRVETAAFLQQVPTTVEWGPFLRWNCGVLLVT